MMAKLHDILLVEKNHMVGSVIASTARQLHLANVRKVSNLANAKQYLADGACSALITTIEDEAADLEFLTALRQSAFRVSPNIPVVIITPSCSEEFVEKLKPLQIDRILLKPFKVRDVITTIELVTKPALS